MIATTTIGTIAAGMMPTGIRTTIGPITAGTIRTPDDRTTDATTTGTPTIVGPTTTATATGMMPTTIDPIRTGTGIDATTRTTITTVDTMTATHRTIGCGTMTAIAIMIDTTIPTATVSMTTAEAITATGIRIQ